MKICYKCNIEKEDKEFQTYWHSTQQKFRIRKECTLCLYKQKNERKRLRRLESKLKQVPIPTEIVQPAVQELQPAILEIPKDYRKCKTCGEVKLISQYHRYSSYNKKPFLSCKTCVNIRENVRTKNKRLKYLEENGGSNDFSQTPNEYIDEYQKDATFNLMRRFGWTFNEENGIWWKEGIKTADGVFINVTKRKRKKVNPMAKIPLNLRIEKKEELFNETIKLRSTGLSFDKIGKKLGVSDTTIYKWIKNYNEKESNGGTF
jgi:hypothetical protein